MLYCAKGGIHTWRIPSPPPTSYSTCEKTCNKRCHSLHFAWRFDTCRSAVARASVGRTQRCCFGDGGDDDVDCFDLLDHHDVPYQHNYCCYCYSYCDEYCCCDVGHGDGYYDVVGVGVGDVENDHGELCLRIFVVGGDDGFDILAAWVADHNSCCSYP